MTATSVYPVGKSIGPGVYMVLSARTCSVTQRLRLPIDICSTLQFMQIDAVERRSGRAYARLMDQKYRGSSSLDGATAALWAFLALAAQRKT